MASKKSVLIVVHGMGEQRRNSSLLGVTRSLVDLMGDRGNQEWKPEISGDLAFSAQSDAEVKYGDRTWQFAEYWWAENFIPAATFKVAMWIAFGLRSHLGSMRKSMGHARRDLTEKNVPKDPLSARLYNIVALPMYSALLILLSIVTPILMLLLVLLGFVKLVPGVPSFIGYTQKLLARIGVDYLGDIYIYLKDPIQAALIRDGLVRMIEEAVRDEEVGRIVFLAHSTGNLIVYDALAHLNSNASVDLAKVKAFVSIGSIQPMAWNRRIVGEIEERFMKPMPAKMHWYFLWTRFDIGPAGPLLIPPLDGETACSTDFV